MSAYKNGSLNFGFYFGGGGGGEFLLNLQAFHKEIISWCDLVLL